MGVRKRGSFSGLKRDARKSVQIGIRQITHEVARSVISETPRRTGKLRAGWKEESNDLIGRVGNVQEYAPVVAYGRRDRRMSSRERRNTGFHVRGVNQAVRRLGTIFQAAFRVHFRQ